MLVCKMEFQPVSKLYCQATTGTQVSGRSEVNMMQPVMGDCEEIEPSYFFPWGHPSPVENLVSFMADVRHTPSRSRTHIPVVHRCWASIPLHCQASIAKPGRMGDWGKAKPGSHVILKTPASFELFLVEIVPDTPNKFKPRNRLHLYHRCKLCIWWRAFRSALNET